jgi:hypothetical protein
MAVHGEVPRLDTREGTADFDEEIFGPVISVVPFEDEADAIRIANSSEYTARRPGRARTPRRRSRRPCRGVRP